jgi:hypothetical protein
VTRAAIETLLPSLISRLVTAVTFFCAFAAGIPRWHNYVTEVFHEEPQAAHAAALGNHNPHLR